MSELTANDADDAIRIRELADDLNAAIVRANARGLHVNLGISINPATLTTPSYAEVRVTTVERRRWRAWEAEP